MALTEANMQSPITPEQVQAYHRDGFLVVENVLDATVIQDLKRVTTEFVERSRAVSEHTKVYDLEDGHSADDPRVRRIKTPHLHDQVYADLIRHPSILAVLRQLIGPSIRFDTSKLNLKSAGYGAAVEWHQDWPFYPHTNDDLAAVGVMIDDMQMVNGPLLCVPGTHRGPVFDHHDEDGYFCGAIDPTRQDVNFASAVPCVGPAGSISIHHVRTLHGSAVNTSDQPRRLLLLQYRAADAWPLLARGQMEMDDWKSLLLCGENDPRSPRCAAVPVRLPLPAALNQGSIYENQRTLKSSFFGTAEAPKAWQPATQT